MAAQLIITEPSGRKRVVPLVKGDTLSVGRGTGNGIIVVDPLVSRKHCTISWGDDGIRLEDHASQNGAWVGGKRVRETRSLRDNDEIAVGNCKIRVVTLWEGKGVVGGSLIPRKLAAACAAVLMLAVGAAIGAISAPSLFPPVKGGAPQLPKPGPTVTASAGAGDATVETQPAGAMVYVNSTFVGTTPLTLPREKGRYSLRVSMAGYEPVGRAVDIDGRAQRIAIELVPMEVAYIDVASEPADAEVLLDGTKAGKTPLKLKTLPGTHSIVLQKVNYCSWDGLVEAEAGKTVQVSESLESRQVVSYLDLLKKDPNNVSYYCELGHLYVLEKRWAEAYDAFRKGMEVFCEGKDTSNYAPRLKWEFEKIYFGDYFEVADPAKHQEVQQWIVSLFGEMVKKYPDQKANLLAWLTGILKRAGREGELVKILEDAQGEPNLEIYYQAADIYVTKRKHQRAVGILNQAAMLAPKSCRVYAKLGETHLQWLKAGRAESRDDALKNLDKAIELCKDEAERKRIQELRHQVEQQPQVRIR